MRFKDIVGQEVVANQLTEIIDSGRISHAQMFIGRTVSGSLALALAYAQYLGCSNRRHYEMSAGSRLRADSCGECPNCKKYQQLSHPDLHLYFPNTSTENVKNPSCADFGSEFRDFLASNNQMGTLDDWYDFLGVENKQGEIRTRDANDMVNILGLKPYEAGYKVVVIWMAEKMNTTMSNKILKNLEEPMPHTLIMLVVENQEKMLSTIVSRTQKVFVPNVNTRTSRWAGEVVVREENRELFNRLFVTWMRQLFKLNMSSLSSWVDEVHSWGREQKKQFLLYAQESVRECFLRSQASVPLQIDFGDEKFNSSFPSMITERNIEGLNEAFNNTIYAIERNAYAKIALMELSFSISKWLKKR